MVELKASKSKDGILLSGSLPQDILSASSVELFALRDGFYLLSTKGALEGAAKQAEEAEALSEKEKEVLRKLLSVRFEKRTPSEISKLLSKDEKEVLDDLIKKKAVQLFQSGKYAKSGVYNISDSAFFAARKTPPSPPASPALPSAKPVLSPAQHLELYGWMVLENEAEARAFAAEFSEKIRLGEVVGMRAFDRKYYFVSRSFYEAWEKRIQPLLSKSEKPLEKIAAEAGMEPDGCKALLYHMCEAGDAMERRRGMFSKA